MMKLYLQGGKIRMYNIGKWYKRRYLTLANQITSHRNISVKSSGMDRTIMSAQCFLAGFFPPKDEQRFEKSLPWQPIPIHTTPLEYDNVRTSYFN